MKRTRRLAVIAAIIYILTLILSVSFLATQTIHEHIGEEECAICTLVRSCNERLHTVDAAPRADKEMPERSFFVLRRTRAEHVRADRYATPVSLKDKLTD